MFQEKSIIDRLADKFVGNLRNPAGLNVVDISHHQRGIDIEKMMVEGEQNAIILRATVGANFRDREIGNYADQLYQMKDKGINPFIGFYAFSTLGNTVPTSEGVKADARQEAEDFVKCVGDYFPRAWEKGLMCPWLDMELTSSTKRSSDSQFKKKPGDQLSPEQTRDFFYDWRYRVGELTGRWDAGVYSGKWFWLSKERGFGGSSDLFDVPFWMASYTKKPRQLIASDGKEWIPDIWQFTGKGKLPGFKGKVDKNVTLCSRARFGQILGYQGLADFVLDPRFEDGDELQKFFT